MRVEFDEALCARFPVLYQDRHLSMQETCMCWGFDCGDGWFQILWNLGLALEKVAPQTVASQVKEKFGTLRYYVWKCNDEGYKAISAAEHLTHTTCEECGWPETIVGPVEPRGYWIVNACKECRALGELRAAARKGAADVPK